MLLLFIDVKQIELLIFKTFRISSPNLQLVMRMIISVHNAFALLCPSLTQHKHLKFKKIMNIFNYFAALVHG